jgi:hypothetical protein
MLNYKELNGFNNFMANIKTFNDLETKIGTLNNTTLKGNMFEYFTYFLFKVHPDYDNLEEIYLYNDIPDDIKQQFKLPKTDMGIDLICKLDDIWHTIQCKYRRDKKTTSWRGVSTFVASSVKFKNRAIFVTNSNNVVTELKTTPNMINLYGSFWKTVTTTMIAKIKIIIYQETSINNYAYNLPSNAKKRTINMFHERFNAISTKKLEAMYPIFLRYIKKSESCELSFDELLRDVFTNYFNKFTVNKMNSFVRSTYDFFYNNSNLKYPQYYNIIMEHDKITNETAAFVQHYHIDDNDYISAKNNLNDIYHTLTDAYIWGKMNTKYYNIREKKHKFIECDSNGYQSWFINKLMNCNDVHIKAIIKLATSDINALKSYESENIIPHDHLEKISKQTPLIFKYYLDNHTKNTLNELLFESYSDGIKPWSSYVGTYEYFNSLKKTNTTDVTSSLNAQPVNISDGNYMSNIINNLTNMFREFMQ